MKTRSLLIVLTIVIVGAAVAGWFVANRQAPALTPQTSVTPNVVPAPTPNQPLVTSTPEPIQVEETAAPTNIVRQTAAPGTGSQPVAVAPATTPSSEIRPLDPVAKEELGRAALSFVGADPVADEVWTLLIYDPSLSDNVREDLMEDLNENGFSAGEGRTATVDDLPLIEARIVMLEEHMQGADDFMLEHLGEAHKDLVNMWFTLTGR
jgi:hypothetical protein